jgi:hypothetical protein
MNVLKEFLNNPEKFLKENAKFELDQGGEISYF